MCAKLQKICNELVNKMNENGRNKPLPYKASALVDDALMANSEIRRFTQNIIDMHLSEADVMRMAGKILIELGKADTALKGAKSCGE